MEESWSIAPRKSKIELEREARFLAGGSAGGRAKWPACPPCRNMPSANQSLSLLLPRNSHVTAQDKDRANAKTRLTI